ncbi:hypothetical protein LWI29_003476 [Acer saccharum]|uniref:Pentatricopeptide repeat-containing protein n=1 Tax=Acer saccharum TaxID=4024 RepID=A0AA39RX29_ACESA|nr:hypothetical protein LWI29_003476 [Acer saccharum]
MATQAALLSQLSKPAPLFNCPRRHRSSVFHALRSSENLLISTSKCLRIHGLMDFFLLGLLTTNSHNANDNECPVREKNNQLQPFFNPETSSKPSIFHSNTDRSQPSEEMFHSERANYAILSLTQMKEPNVFVYNALIKGFVHCAHLLKALQFYMSMLRANVFPTSYTFSSLIKACTLLLGISVGKAVHGHIWKHGFDAHVFVQTALIDFYSNLNKISESRRVFDEMPERDVFSWTTMVSAYVRDGYLCSARRLFDEMPEKNIATWNTMIDWYARLGNVGAAELLFNEMPAKDIISWTTMITCYSQNKQFREALYMFNDMKMNGFSPDEVTISSVISACAHLGALDLGKEIHLYLMQNGFNLDVYIGSALIDMYAKCGSLDRSLSVFFKLQEKNLFVGIQ